MKRDCQCPRARHQHGTRAAYQADQCRCFPCRVAHAQYMDAYRRGLPWIEYPTIDPHGTARRLQALGALGHSRAALGQRLGVSGRRIQQLRHGGQRVTPRVAAAVVALYDELCFVRPAGKAADITRTQARKLGWLPPLAWDDDEIDDPSTRRPHAGDTDAMHINEITPAYGRAGRIPRDIDEIAVERAIRGDRVRLTMAEKSVVHARLNSMGFSASQIAERLGTTKRTVQRRRSAA